MTLVIALALVQYTFVATDYQWIDKILVTEIAVACALLILVIAIGTPKPWDGRATGVLLFVASDAILYGLIALPLHPILLIVHKRRGIESAIHQSLRDF